MSGGMANIWFVHGVRRSGCPDIGFIMLEVGTGSRGIGANHVG